MSSGGIDWAYRMIAAHPLDALGVAVVLHLGLRDAANLRTDRGIADALSRSRSAVQKATAKLAQLGVIERRSGQWVACETIAIVEQAPNAPRPSRASSDDRVALPEGRPAEGAGDGPPRGPQKALPEGRPSMKYEIKKARPGARASKDARGPVRAVPSVEHLSPFQRKQLREGQGVVVDGVVYARGAVETVRLAERSIAWERSRV